MSVAGCFFLALNCDDPHHLRGVERNAQFTGKNLSEALRAARAAGWYVVKAKALCPTCRAATRPGATGCKLSDQAIGE